MTIRNERSERQRQKLRYSELGIVTILAILSAADTANPGRFHTGSFLSFGSKGHFAQSSIWLFLPRREDARPACRDPEDDNIIATAVAGKCACIVTGDKDLLDLECAGNIRIIAPASFWQFEAATG